MENKKQTVTEKINGDVTYNAKKNKRMNILAFVGCVLLAFIVWFYVMNVKMSDYTQTFSVDLDIKGESTLLSETGYSVFMAGNDLVKVTIQGTKTEIQRYSYKDFKVYVDVSDVDETGMIPLNIAVETPSTNTNVVSLDPVVATVMIDIKTDKQMTLEALPHDSEAKVNLVLNESTFTVTGPKTYVDKIASATVTVNVNESDIGKEYNYSADISFFDENGAVIAPAYLTYDLDYISVVVCEKEAE